VKQFFRLSEAIELHQCFGFADVGRLWKPQPRNAGRGLQGLVVEVECPLGLSELHVAGAEEGQPPDERPGIARRPAGVHCTSQFDDARVDVAELKRDDPDLTVGTIGPSSTSLALRDHVGIVVTELRNPEIRRRAD